MENYLWQKTLLDMYNTFDRAIMVSNNKFERLVASSLYNHSTSLMFEEMILLMARKNNCLLAKEIVNKGLNFLTANGKKILYCYYKNKISFKKIAEQEQINIRQVFRNYDKELSSFAHYLSIIGYSAEVIQKEFGEDSIFVSTYERLRKKASTKGQMSIQLPSVYRDESSKNSVQSSYSMTNYITILD